MATKEYSNPMKTAKVTFKVTGMTDVEVKEYFAGKKVTASKSGANWIATYTARGAAKNDVKKRLDAMVAATDKGKFEIVSAEVTTKK